MKGFVATLTLGLLGSLLTSKAADAQLTLIDQFNPAETGGIVGCGFDVTTGHVWIYGSFAGQIHGYTCSGALVGSIIRPGESADDADLEFAPEAMTLNGTPIEAGTLLMINGETGPAEIYALDKTDGRLLATLETSFGMSHVVGGAYHPDRDTFFLVQDRQPAGAENKSIVAEVDPADGSVLNTFKVDEVLPGYTVNFGDLDINGVTGHLFIVSSDEGSIAEFTPDGEFVQTLALPTGVSSLSGIALNEARGEAWVTSSSGVGYRIGNVRETCLPDLDGSGTVGITDLLNVLIAWGPCADPCPPSCPQDLDGDHSVGITDLLQLLSAWGPCP